MRISDWSSDVCSSDLVEGNDGRYDAHRFMAHQRGLAWQRIVSQLRLREALRLLDGIVEIGERRQMTRLVLRHAQTEFMGAQLYEAGGLAGTIVPRRAGLFGTAFQGSSDRRRGGEGGGSRW